MEIRRVALLMTALMAIGQVFATDSPYRELEELGKALYAKDRAAWLATDRLMEDGQSPEGLWGWVTVPAEGDWRVFFVQQEGDDYCSRFSVLVDEKGAGPLDRAETCEPLSSEQRAMFLARQTAISALRMPCSNAYNTVVLPHEGGEAAWAVYLLAATQEARKIVVGGHVRVLVGERGLKIVDYHPLSNTCLTLELPAPSEAEVEAVAVSHVLDDHPIETHVFVSLLHRLELYVMTESALWSVDEGRITLLMDGEDYKAYLEAAEAAGEEQEPVEKPAPE